MRLAAKLTLSLASLAVLAILTEAWMEQRRRADLLAMDTAKDWRVGLYGVARWSLAVQVDGLQTPAMPAGTQSAF